jgi:hypothetical protein
MEMFSERVTVGAHVPNSCVGACPLHVNRVQHLTRMVSNERAVIYHLVSNLKLEWKH